MTKKIILEGPDASGKGTLAKALVKELNDNTECIKFPRVDSPIYPMIRAEMDKPDITTNSSTMDLLNQLDLRHYQINNHNLDGHTVIFDRHPAISSIMYTSNPDLVDFMYSEDDYISKSNYIFILLPGLSVIKKRLVGRNKLDEYEKNTEFVQYIYEKYNDFCLKYINPKYQVYSLSSNMSIEENIEFIKFCTGLKGVSDE